MAGGGERPIDENSSRPRQVLRGHHLLCILGFRGLGYDEEFVANMTRVVEFMRSHPDAMLLLCDSADCICQACPHLSAQGCTRDEDAGVRVRERDSAVLRRLGVEAGAEISVSHAYAGIKSNLTRGNMSEDVCAGCEWEHCGYCAEGLSRLKRHDGRGLPWNPRGPASGRPNTARKETRGESDRPLLPDAEGREGHLR